MKEDHLYRSGSTVNFEYLLPCMNCLTGVLTMSVLTTFTRKCSMLLLLQGVRWFASYYWWAQTEHSDCTVCTTSALLEENKRKKNKLEVLTLQKKTEYHWSNLVGLKHFSFVQLFVIDVRMSVMSPCTILRTSLWSISNGWKQTHSLSAHTFSRCTKSTRFYTRNVRKHVAS